ncbi:branched-chain amino acid aminotransferase [Stella humosa]|uniref:Probable branched-chain-amino-acid aminotransferase n=1 Tax=Stella humosa TaxID=94 RepID=A0A3N1KSM5_9PROT|nr:aminotransferase class IV [Stella humosa]ROP81278.1 branched-chain amino acid aminotransferase [Stella humosa]BBK32627.1 branched chain amino acid aminotransferase [Stella humosa]
MSNLSNQRVAYFNGQIVPESEVRVSFRDRGFKYGDAVFDMTRTFNKRVFKLKEHIDRFYSSLRYVRIDPGMSPAEMTRLSEEVLERNMHLLGGDDDYWLGQRVSRGVDAAPGETREREGATVIIECSPLPLKSRARFYRDGIDVVVPPTRRTPPEALSPRAKTHNYLNMIIGEMEAKTDDPDVWAVLLDTSGNLAEGIGSNIFVIKDNVIRTPRAKFVLPGISRQTAIDLARQEGFVLEETDIDLFDAYVADEIFLTSTSLCICPVRSVNGAVVADGVMPGPVTKRLLDAYVRFVDHDFVAQYLRRLAA